MAAPFDPARVAAQVAALRGQPPQAAAAPPTFTFDQTGALQSNQPKPPATQGFQRPMPGPSTNRHPMAMVPPRAPMKY